MKSKIKELVHRLKRRPSTFAEAFCSSVNCYAVYDGLIMRSADFRIDNPMLTHSDANSIGFEYGSGLLPSASCIVSEFRKFDQGEPSAILKFYYWDVEGSTVITFERSTDSSAKPLKYWQREAFEATLRDAIVKF